MVPPGSELNAIWASPLLFKSCYYIYMQKEKAGVVFQSPSAQASFQWQSNKTSNYRPLEAAAAQITLAKKKTNFPLEISILELAERIKSIRFPSPI